jgi:hypothetical protein
MEFHVSVPTALEPARASAGLQYLVGLDRSHVGVLVNEPRAGPIGHRASPVPWRFPLGHRIGGTADGRSAREVGAIGVETLADESHARPSMHFHRALNPDDNMLQGGALD